MKIDTKNIVLFIVNSSLTKWFLIFSITILIPLILFALFWINYFPPNEIFLSLLGAYLVLSILLLVPFIKNANE